MARLDLHPRLWLPAFAILVVALFAALPAAAALPDRLTAVYALSYGNMPLGTVETQLVRNGNGQYETSMETQANAVARALIGSSLSETGTFHLVDGEIRPLRYMVVREGRGASIDTAVFDWHNRKVHFNDGRSETMPREGAIDVNSLLYAYMLSPPRDLKGKRIHVVDGRNIRLFEYGEINHVVVDTALGSMRVVRVEQRRVDRPDRYVTLWMAPELEHLPVRIENSRDGREITLTLQSVDGL